MDIFGISFSKFDIWLLSIAGALSLILLRQWIADSRQNAHIILASGKKLRDVFFDDLLILKKGIDSNFAANPCDYLGDRFHVHEVAALNFAENIGWFKRKRFIRAWHVYCGKESKDDTQNLFQYSSSGHDPEEITRRKKLAIQRIEHLLSFTKT